MIQGQIVNVQKFHLITQPVTHLQLVLVSEGNEYIVEIGPEEYVRSQGIVLIPMEDIEVEGECTKEKDQIILYASKLRQGNKKIYLRDALGDPLWNKN